MFNRSEILRKAWAGYRVNHRYDGANAPFNRSRLAFEMQLAWAGAKRRAREAAPNIEPVVGPVATVMGAVNLLDAVTAARATTLRSEILWQEMGDQIDWAAYRAASAELATLTA